MCDLLRQIRSMAENGAVMVSMQEAAGMGMTDQVEALIANASALAKEQGIYIILPILDVEKSPVENVVHIIDPNGEVVLTHVKYGGNQFEGVLNFNEDTITTYDVTGDVRNVAYAALGTVWIGAVVIVVRDGGADRRLRIAR